MNEKVAELRQFIAAERQRIIERHHYQSEGIVISGREIMQEHTRVADTVLLRLYGYARDAGQLDEETTLTVVALGGYGREELNPYSDLDILILHEPSRCTKKTLESFAGMLITALWDVGFEVGHGVRTIRECRTAAATDMDSRTAMLEGRYVVGNRTLYKKFEHEIKTRAMRRGVRPFVQEKIGEWRTQMGDPKATVYVQEPDIKNGVGGLRSVHMARWVARTRFNAWEFEDLVRIKLLPENTVVQFRESLDFLWRVRNELHYISGKRIDHLTFNVQEQVAKRLGYEDRGRQLAEEQLMRDYFRAAHWIHECARIIIFQSRWEISPVQRIVDRVASKHLTRQVVVLRDRVRLTPNALEKAFEAGEAEELLILLFVYRAELGLPLSVTTRRQVVAALPRLADSFRSSELVLTTFLDILGRDENVSNTLRDMHHLGVLELLIPEWEGLRALVKYDLYHQFTVDEHTIVAVSNLESGNITGIHRGESLLQAFHALHAEDRVALRLAMMLHDVGKGAPGDGGHVEKGTDMTRKIVARLFPLTDEQADDVIFLVEQHHLMSHTAQRRDLDDREVIERFAKAVGSLKRARLLYLLTHADIRAVNAELWTDWTASLLDKLYLRTEQYFLGEFRVSRAELEAMCARVAELLGDGWGEAVHEHITQMGSERMAFYTRDEIAAQVRAVADYVNDRRRCVFRVFRQSVNHSATVFVAGDRPGLFAEIAGVLAASDIAILSADLNTRRDGIAVDTLHIADGKTGASIDEARCKQLEAMLERAGRGDATVAEMLEERAKQRKRGNQHRTMQIAPIVRANNEDSAYYTILDVRAQDRLGLLYTITHTLSELGLDISLAKISTEAYRAVDVFYVADEKRQKIHDPERLRDIVQTLQATLEES
ncbi:MAG: [protein-PII] uridylyltransferase [Candidatus Poribacteria bacterium]|nr:[protein-PII] uridylyltransferase [Candidatus Poribacteria bacterium]